MAEMISTTAHWQRILERIPAPIRVIVGLSLLISLGFSISSPSSTVNLPPWLSFLVLLPAAIVSVGLSLYILYLGCKTLVTTFRSIMKGEAYEASLKRRYGDFIGGVSALQIYMIIYMLLAFWLGSLTHNYGASTVLSFLLVGGLGYSAITRKPHPKDVRIFLWGGLIISVFFGIIMATVAVPPA